MERLKRLVQALDDFQQGRSWLAFPVAVVNKYGEDQAGQRAALLAYYGFFSLFPLLLVAVTVLSLVLQGRSDLGGRVVDSTLAPVPGHRRPDPRRGRGQTAAGQRPGPGRRRRPGPLGRAWGGRGRPVGHEGHLERPPPPLSRPS
jgi:hypothetical protein